MHRVLVLELAQVGPHPHAVGTSGDLVELDRVRTDLAKRVQEVEAGHRHTGWRRYRLLPGARLENMPVRRRQFLCVHGVWLLMASGTG